MEKNENKRRFIDLLSKYRERKGYNKTELSKLIGVSPTSVIKYEDPKSPNKPKMETLSKICLVLDLDEDEKNEFYEAAMLSTHDIEKVNVLLKSMLSPMFDDEVVEVITEKEMLDILEKLVNLDKPKRKEALKSLQAFMRGFY